MEQTTLRFIETFLALIITDKERLKMSLQVREIIEKHAIKIGVPINEVNVFLKPFFEKMVQEIFSANEKV